MAAEHAAKLSVLQSLQRLKLTSLPERLVHLCMRCNRRFSLLHRKQLCALCGRVFCPSCTSAQLVPELYGRLKGQLRHGLASCGRASASSSC